MLTNSIRSFSPWSVGAKAKKIMVKGHGGKKQLISWPGSKTRKNKRRRSQRPSVEPNVTSPRLTDSNKDSPQNSLVSSEVINEFTH